MTEKVNENAFKVSNQTRNDIFVLPSSHFLFESMPLFLLPFPPPPPPPPATLSQILMFLPSSLTQEMVGVGFPPALQFRRTRIPSVARVSELLSESMMFGGTTKTRNLILFQFPGHAIEVYPALLLVLIFACKSKRKLTILFIALE